VKILEIQKKLAELLSYVIEVKNDKQYQEVRGLMCLVLKNI